QRSVPLFTKIACSIRVRKGSISWGARPDCEEMQSTQSGRRAMRTATKAFCSGKAHLSRWRPPNISPETEDTVIRCRRAGHSPNDVPHEDGRDERARTQTARTVISRARDLLRRLPKEGSP